MTSKPDSDASRGGMIIETVEEFEFECAQGLVNSQVLYLHKRLLDVVAALENLDQRVQRLEQMEKPILDRIETTDHLLQSLDLLFKEVRCRIEESQNEIKTLSSRVRANPFRNAPILFPSTGDGSLTMGFTTSNSGQYVDFIEAFRPSFEELLSQLSYLGTWLPVSGIGVDLGAGRGELVQLMRDHGLSTFGIDSDHSVVASALKRGLDVRLYDIESYLDGCTSSSLDVVTAIQVVEHVDTDQLISWFEKIQRVLKPGGVFIAETPNPHAIDAFKAFWVDVTHVRPYYPESLLHMAQSAGFSRAEIWAPGEQDNITDRLEFAGSYTLIATA